MADQAALVWIKGKLAGTCIGKPTKKRGGSGLARWYRLDLVEATISDWQPVPGPPKDAPKGAPPFSQAKLVDARLRSSAPGGTDELISLRELSVWDWDVREQREGGGESRCSLVGTVYARVVGGTRRPVPPEERLGFWGFLLGMVMLAVATWLWWTCGPFTCGLWASVVVGSWFTHGLRTRRRSPPTTLSTVLQSCLALGILVGGFALAMWAANPARSSACGGEAAAAVLLGIVAVIAISVLTISWPRLWIWTVWTILVGLWCGHTGTDCAFQWIKEATAKGPIVPLEEKLQKLRGQLLGTPLAGADAGTPPADAGSCDAGSGAGGSGSGGGAAGGSGGGGAGGGGGGGGGDGTGSGSGSGGGSGAGAGSGAGGGSGGGGGAGGSGSGSGSGSGGGSGDGSGSGGSAADGKGAGGAAQDGSASGAAGGDKAGADGKPGGAAADKSGASASADSAGDKGPKPGIGDDTREASSEPRMSVEKALRDPKPFLDGTARVTLAGDLLFSFDEDQLRPQAEPKLREVARLLALDKDSRVLLEGHADTIGGDDYNVDLSERRAKAVGAWLVGQGHVDPERIDTIGYGNAKPLVPASRSPSEQAANRRVEIRLMSR